jgi:hypothetical protein
MTIRLLFEISNENHPPSTEWQYPFIRFIHDYEKTKPKQHPVGMTFQYQGGANATLVASPAEWISPNPDAERSYDYRTNPPAADGRKIILSDTDHLWGIGGDVAWVWKSFLRGLNPLFMDPYKRDILSRVADEQWEPVRKALGLTRRLAGRIHLATMVPHSELASKGYCLADASREYLVFLPDGGEVKMDLSSTAGELAVEWLDPVTGSSIQEKNVPGGALRILRAPSKSQAVLHLVANKP